MHSHQQSQRFSTTLGSTCPNIRRRTSMSCTCRSAAILPHASADAHAHYPTEWRHPDHHWARYCSCSQDNPKVEHALSALMQYQAAQHRDRHEDWWRERSAEVNLIDLRSRAPSSHVPELRNTHRAEWLGSAECCDRYCEH